MIKFSKKKELRIRAGFLLGTSLLFLNINALYLSASSKAALLVGETAPLTQNEYADTTESRTILTNATWTSSCEEELTEVSALWEAQLHEMLMNDAPQDSVKVCETFYTTADVEALSLPTVSVTKDTALLFSPSEEASKITTFSSTTTATLLFRWADWCYVELSGTYRGYVPSDAVDLSDLTEDELDALDLVNKCHYGILADSSLTLYSQPDEDASTLEASLEDSVWEVLGYVEEGDWYLVNTSAGEAYVRGEDITVDWYLACEVDEEGYIRSVHEEIKAREEAERKEAERKAAAAAAAASKYTVSFDSVNASELASYALNFLGTPYVYGGASPSGFDCSGLVYYIYSHFNLSVPRGAGSQYSSCRKISKSELQPGDLVFFSYSGTLDHVGIYIGNGQFIHSPRSGDVVKINSLSDSWYASTYYAAGTFFH